MNLTNELFDNAISFNRLIWICNDESADKLFEVSKRHIALAKEHIDADTTNKRRQAIKCEIERLRVERDAIVSEVVKQMDNGVG